MRILRSADHRAMPWKNGGGVTTEIAVFPESSGLDAFEWRLSMATVASDGPFSLFPGVDRTLAVLEGEGIVLSAAGLPDETLTRASQPFAFSADQAVSARLLAGPIVDLNIMTRRGRWTHRVEGPLDNWAAAPREDGFVIVFCAIGAAAVASGLTQSVLGPRDAALLGAAMSCTLTNEEGAELYIVTLDRRQGAMSAA